MRAEGILRRSIFIFLKGLHPAGAAEGHPAGKKKAPVFSAGAEFLFTKN
jgi:hypothetical protein